MNNCPEVAVILCVYKNDTVDFFSKAIESLIHQTYKNIRIYIFQDGYVSDAIKNHLLKISSLSNVHVFHSDRNVGLAVGLNTLIDAVVSNGSAKYVARMDSDDISRLDRFEKQVLFMEGNPSVDVSGGYCREFGASFALEKKCLPLEHNALVNFSVARCPFIHPTTIFRTGIFVEGFRYPMHTNLTEDMALWLLLIKNGKHFANIPEVLLDYRMSDSVLTRRRGLRKGINEFVIRFKFMMEARLFSLNNMMLVCSRLVFHCLPRFLVAFCYAKIR